MSRINVSLVPGGFWYAYVVSIDNDIHVSVKIPKLGGESVYEQVRCSGFKPSVGDYVWVSFIEGDPGSLVAFSAETIEDLNIPGTTGEPTGHEDRTQSIISFNNSNRTFSITPASSSHTIWCQGKRYVKTATESVQIDNATDLYFIYYNTNGVLEYQTDYFYWDSETPTAYVYWNAVTQRAEFFADERHGITMDWQTHEYLHRTRGAAIANGFDASNFDVSTQDGDTDAQAQLDISNGTFFDEDLQVDIEHSTTPEENTWQQQLQGPARIPVFYRSGTGWVEDAPTDFPVKQGPTRPVYNRTSDWSTQELDANSYGVQWIVATNQLNYPVLSIMGQQQYANIGQAEAASWSDMILTDLPIAELRVLYKIIFRATGTNTVGCYFTEIDDYRTALSSATSTAAAVVDHGNLTGLNDDDHTQYALADGSRGSGFDHGGLTGLTDDDHTQYLLVSGIRPATSLSVSGNLTVDTNTLYVNSTNNRVGIGTTSPLFSLHVSGDIFATNAAFIAGYVDANNVDHLWHDDATNSWNFCSDTTYKAAGNSILKASALTATGTVTAGGLTVDTNTLHVDATNNRVGVGTASPSATLHVSSGTAGDAELRIEADTDNNNEGDNPLITLVQDGGYFTGVIGLDGNNLLNIVNAATTGAKVRIGTTGGNLVSGQSVITALTNPGITVDSSNNVGVKNSSPTVELDVTGSAKISSGLTVDTDTLHVDASNNRVGIGTNFPLFTLDVYGTARMTSATVTTASTTENVLRNIKVSTDIPTGGADGDVWMVYS